MAKHAARFCTDPSCCAPVAEGPTEADWLEGRDPRTEQERRDAAEGPATVTPDDWHPYDDKSIAEVVHDFAVVRGDLSEQYARDQLVRVIERRVGALTADLAAAERSRDRWHVTARDLFDTAVRHKRESNEARQVIANVRALHERPTVLLNHSDLTLAYENTRRALLPAAPTGEDTDG